MQDSDCDASQGQWVCMDNVCQPLGGDDVGEDGTATGSGDSMGSEGGDATDGDTTSGGTETEDTTDPTGVQCTANSGCTMDQRCHSDGTCVNLISSECQVLRWPEGDRDNVIFLGSIIPTSGAFETILQPLENAVQLAFDDFNSETTLQGDRQIAWLGCDSSAGTDAAVSAAEHLIEVAEVPGIVGPIFSEEVKAVANQVAVDAGVMLITPTASAPSVSEIDDNDFVWRTIAPDYHQAAGIVDLMAERENPQHLLVLAKDDAYGNEMLDLISTELAGQGALTVTKYPNPTNYDSMEEQLTAYSSVISGRIAPYAYDPAPGAQPPDDPFYDEILIVGTAEAQILVYSFISAYAQTTLWGEQDMGEKPALPIFRVTHGAVPQMETMVEDFGLEGTSTAPLAALKPALFANMKGISPVIFDNANFNTFNIRYKIAFGGDAVTASGLAYDAALVLAFTSCTIPADAAPTGTMLRDAMPRLQSGMEVNVGGSGVSFISQARNALFNDDVSIDLRGVSGDLDWDGNGDVRAGCIDWTLSGDENNASVSPAQYYCLNPPPDVDGAWQGSPCPD